MHMHNIATRAIYNHAGFCWGHEANIDNTQSLKHAKSYIVEVSAACVGGKFHDFHGLTDNHKTFLPAE